MSITTDDSTTGFIVQDDQGDPYWFLNTLTITKIGSHHTNGDFSLVDHRMPAGFAPPPHVHHGTDEAFYVVDGELAGFCGGREWRATPGSVVFLPRDVPHGYHVSEDAPARILIVTVRDRFDGFVAAVGEPAHQLTLPEPVPPDGPRVAEVAASFNIEILRPSN
jgi:quercetin dioxygenase-like cupin family protein